MSAKATKFFIIGTFVTLYLLVSIISTIHVIDFFLMSNPKWLAISLAIAFEVGAAASLAAIITLEKMHKGMVWGLFILLTLMQAMGNTYYTYIHLKDFNGWVELFGLVEEELIYQKRVLSIVSGAILPIVALGFIKSLVDYIRPDKVTSETPEATVKEEVKEEVNETYESPTTIEPVQEVSSVTVASEPEIVEIPKDIAEPEQEISAPPVEVLPEKIEQPKDTTTTTTTPDNWVPIAGSDRSEIVSNPAKYTKQQPSPDKSAKATKVDNNTSELTKDERLARGFRIDFRDSI